MIEFCPCCEKNVEAAAEAAKGMMVCPICGTDIRPLASALPHGTMIGGFRIEDEIGRGGMGIVYRACQVNLKRDTALKILSDELAGKQSFVESFFNEARAAANLSHPNIVQAYDAGVTEDGFYYFAMELIRGESLEQKISNFGALPLISTLTIAKNIADALAYSWNSRKMSHGDIKPDNIILTDSGICKLADLGLAKSMYEEKSTNRDVMVTPLYAAPEIISGRETSVNMKSDMYSFGATFYHALAGTPLFSGEKIEDIYRHHLETPPELLSSRNPNVPQSIADFLGKMLEKDPAKRPESWDAIAGELQDILDEQKNRDPIVYAQSAGTSKALKIMQGIALTTFLCMLCYAAILLFTGREETKTHPQKNTPRIRELREELAKPVRKASVKKNNFSAKKNDTEKKVSNRKKTAHGNVPPVRTAQKKTPATPAVRKQLPAKPLTEVEKKWECLKKILPTISIPERNRRIAMFIDEYISDESLPREVYAFRDRISREFNVWREHQREKRKKLMDFLDTLSSKKHCFTRTQIHYLEKTFSELRGDRDIAAMAAHQSESRKKIFYNASALIEKAAHDLEVREKQEKRFKNARSELSDILKKYIKNPSDPAFFREIHAFLSKNADMPKSSNVYKEAVLLRNASGRLASQVALIMRYEYLLKNLPAGDIVAGTVFDSISKDRIRLRFTGQSGKIVTKVPLSLKNRKYVMDIFRKFRTEPKRSVTFPAELNYYFLTEDAFRIPERLPSLLNGSILPQERKKTLSELSRAVISLSAMSKEN